MGSLSLRASLIYAALVCLCLSDGVGSRLVPYPKRETAGSARPEVVENPSGGQTSLAEDGPHSDVGLQAARDTFNKLPVFYATALSLSQSARSCRLAVIITRGRHLPTPVSLPQGRAPPRPA